MLLYVSRDASATSVLDGISGLVSNSLNYFLINITKSIERMSNLPMPQARALPSLSQLR